MRLLLRPLAGAKYCNQFVHNVHSILNLCEFALTINSGRQMAGSPPNLHTMDSRSACIQGVIKVKVKVKCHVIRALLCWQENRFFCQANDRIKASILQSNISSISVTFARRKHHCGRSLLSTIALFLFISTTHLMLIKGRLACMCTWSIGLTFKSRLEIGISIKLRVLLARNLQEVAILLANLLYAQANSVSYPRLGRK